MGNSPTKRQPVQAARIPNQNNLGGMPPGGMNTGQQGYLDPHAGNPGIQGNHPYPQDTTMQGQPPYGYPGQQGQGYGYGGPNDKAPEEQRKYSIAKTVAQIRNSELQEDLPQFSQFVKVIVSPIPYPAEPASFANSKITDKFVFTQNTNIFDVFEEERLAVVPRSEILKPFMILKEALSNGWIDNQLPHNVDSITNDPQKKDIDHKVLWKKLSQLAPPEGFAILYDTNKPTAVIPGLLNDKAFQSALSVLAERQSYLPSIFPEFNETSNSVIAVWLNQMGEWKVYVLDEFFPCDKDTGKFIFSTCENETWVPILEKAFAKMYGNYFLLEKGHPAHFIHDITGAPYKYFYYDDPKACWSFLTSIDRNITTIVAMNKDPKHRIIDENDLSKEPAHSYAVLDFQEVQTVNGIQKLVKLRDPWPQKTWTGDWSNKSTLWTPVINKKLNPEGLTDDIFWISIDDFVTHYGLGFTFRVYPTYQHCSIRLKHSFQRNYSVLLLNLNRKGHLIMKVSQADKRKFLKLPEKYTYSLVQMMVIEVDANLKAKRFVTGIYNKGRDCDCEAQFEAGDYMIYIEVDWEHNVNREIVLSTYGEINAVLYEINSYHEQTEIVKLFMAQYLRNNPNIKGNIDYGYFGDKRVKRYIDYMYGYLCFYYVNDSDLFGLNEKVRMESIFGLQIIAPYTNNFEFDVNVPAGTESMVIYKTTLEGQQKAYYKHISWGYLYPDCSENLTKRLIRARATKVFQRKFSGKDVSIFVFLFQFAGGFCLYFVNKTRYSYTERLSLDLMNIVGFDNSEQTFFEVNLDPNAEVVLKFKVKDVIHPFSYTLRTAYKIYSAGNPLQISQGQSQYTSSNKDNKLPIGGMAPGNAGTGPQQVTPKVVFNDLTTSQMQVNGHNVKADVAQAVMRDKIPNDVARAGAQQKVSDAGGPQPTPKVVNDMLAYQMQNYGYGAPQTTGEQGNKGGPQPNTKVANDMINYQMQTYGQGTKNAAQPVAEGGAQSVPKPVNDMINYQMQNYGQGTKNAGQPEGGAQQMPKPVNDMLNYQMQNYGYGAPQTTGEQGNKGGPQPNTKVANDMINYQMQNYGQGAKNAVQTTSEGGAQSMPKPVNDMLNYQMQQNYQYGENKQMPKAANDMLAYQTQQTYGQGTKNGVQTTFEGGAQPISTKPANDMFAYQMQTYGYGSPQTKEGSAIKTKNGELSSGEQKSQQKVTFGENHGNSNKGNLMPSSYERSMASGEKSMVSGERSMVAGERSRVAGESTSKYQSEYSGESSFPKPVSDMLARQQMQAQEASNNLAAVSSYGMHQTQQQYDSRNRNAEGWAGEQQYQMGFSGEQGNIQAYGMNPQYQYEGNVTRSTTKGEKSYYK